MRRGSVAGHGLLHVHASALQLMAALLGQDPHHRRHARAEAGRHQVGGREEAAAALIVERRVRDEHRRRKGRARPGSADRPDIRDRCRPLAELLGDASTIRCFARRFWQTPPRPPMEIMLLRHGESEGNAQGRMQGRRDYPLSALGREQAALAAAFIGGSGCR